jgi:hypothetical protein
MSVRSAAATPIAAIAVLLAGCTTSARDVREARNSGYQTDFAIVYNATVEATKKLYPQLVEDPRSGVIRTAWHQVPIESGSAGASSDSPVASGSSPIGSATRRRKHYFIRFRVYVTGGKPWRVRIEGEASEWETGAVPAPLKGAEVPPWLEGRVDALRVAIHDKLRAHAVPLATSEKKVAGPVRSDPDATAYGELPPAAAKVIAEVGAAAKDRDYDRLRERLAPDFVWQPGATGADTAMAMFTADGTLLEAMTEALTSCVGAAEGIVCPAAAAEPGFTGYVARFGEVEGAWKMVSFYRQ